MPTWSLNGTIYEKNQARMERLHNLVAECNPVFVTKLAVYALTKMYMRYVPLAQVTELTKLHSGNNLVARVTDGVIGRADEITELLACHETLNQRAKMIKQKGLSYAESPFTNF
ncbi:MAG TPA: hypothetical protein VIM77_00780 [Mucilaginibacter sp.]